MTSAPTSQLAAAAQAVYATLGAGAGALLDDGYVVGLYEMARACGEVSLLLRGAAGLSTVAPTAAVVEVLATALAGDETGALATYATTMVVLPRLLVGLRDVRAVAPPDEAPTLVTATDTLVAALRRLAVYGHDQDIFDDPDWQNAARALSRTLDEAGYAESLADAR